MLVKPNGFEKQNKIDAFAYKDLLMLLLPVRTFCFLPGLQLNPVYSADKHSISLVEIEGYNHGFKKKHYNPFFFI